jgi:hypothetical protein
VKRGIPVFWFACTVGLGQQYAAWTVAGGGQPFTPVAAVNASIASGGLATDAGGNVYIRGFQCVLKVDPYGILTLVAGNGRAGSAQDGIPATMAHLSASGPIASDPMGNIYTVDPSIRVRKISVNGTITTVAGNGTKGSSGDGGPPTKTKFPLRGNGEARPIQTHRSMASQPKRGGHPPPPFPIAHSFLKAAIGSPFTARRAGM